MAAIGWFILGAFIAPGVTWWRAGRRGIAVIVASITVSLPMFMLLALPRAPKLGLAAMIVSIALIGFLFVQGLAAVVVLQRAKQVEPWPTTSIFLVAILLASVPSRLLPKREFESFTSPSGGMDPSLIAGDQFFALKDRKKHPIERGAIVVYRHPESGLNLVQRVIGLAGDTITVEGTAITINGSTLATAPCPDDPSPSCVLESLGNHRWRVRSGLRINGTWEIPPDSMFLVGDNLDNSYDSRTFGAISMDNVVGVARVIHFSWPNVARSGRSIDPEPD